jgi:hydrogenase maturation protease
MRDFKHVRVIAIGNEFRRDDGAGILVAQAIRERTLQDVDICIESGDGSQLMKSFAGVRDLYLIDAVSSGATPGIIHRVDVRAQGIPERLIGRSSHGMTLMGSLEIARVLGPFPESCIFFGIECEDFGWGKGPSGSVRVAIDIVADAVIQEIFQTRHMPIPEACNKSHGPQTNR